LDPHENMKKPRKGADIDRTGYLLPGYFGGEQTLNRPGNSLYYNNWCQKTKQKGKRLRRRNLIKPKKIKTFAGKDRGRKKSRGRDHDKKRG